jgi:hypothetical protein
MLGRRRRRYEREYYRRNRGLKKIFIFIVILAIVLVFIRAKGLKEIDDISPNIPCEQQYMDKADVFWIIPDYNGTSIANNKEWCQKIIVMNKTLGLHGVNHNYKEFEGNVTKEQMEKAIADFKQCFNQTPTMFKSPQLKTSKENLALIQQYNMTYKGSFNQAIHKVYHCNDTGALPNWFNNIF